MWFHLIILQIVLGSCPDTLIEAVGDTTLMDDGSGVYGPSVTVTPHPLWVTIPGHPWVWATDPNLVGTISFKMKFMVASWDLEAAAHIYLELAADNYASAWINGVQVAFDDNGLNSITQYDLLPYLIGSSYSSGFVENTLEFQVTNTDGPGGLTYRIVMNYL